MSRRRHGNGGVRRRADGRWEGTLRLADGRFRPGDVFVWAAGDQTIFNLATPPLPRPSARLEYIEASLRKAVMIAELRRIPLIGMPRIGAGYGGLEWPDVKATFESIAAETPVVLAVYERPGSS